MKYLLCLLFIGSALSLHGQGTNVTIEAKTHVQIEFRHDETGLEIMLIHFEAGKLHEGDTISYALGGAKNHHQEYSIAGKRNTKLEKNNLKIDLFADTIDEIVESGISEIRHNGFLYHISSSDQRRIAQAAKAAFRKKAARVKKEDRIKQDN